MAGNLLKRRKRNDEHHVAPKPIGGWPANVVSRTDPNIGSFDGNATLGGADDESAGATLVDGINPAISVV
jgi:hypothetical protein